MFGLPRTHLAHPEDTPTPMLPPQDMMPTPAESRPERGVHTWKAELDKEIIISVYAADGRRVMHATVPIDADRDYIQDMLLEWLAHYEARPQAGLRLIG